MILFFVNSILDIRFPNMSEASLRSNGAPKRSGVLRRQSFEKRTMIKNIYVIGIISTLLFVPFTSGAFDEQRKFAGYEYDRETGLNYMNARYYV